MAKTTVEEWYVSPEEDAHLSLREKFVTSEKQPEVKLVSLSLW